MPLNELLEKEKTALGFYLSTHPIEEYRPLLNLLEKSKLLCPAIPNTSLSTIKTQCLIALPVSMKIISTKNGKKMAFLNVEDSFSKNLEVIIFPNLFETINFDLAKNGCLAIWGVFEKNGESFKVKAEKIIPCSLFFSSPELNLQLKIEIIADQINNIIEKLKEALIDGNATVSILMTEQDNLIKIKPQKKLGLSIDGLKLISDETFFNSKLILSY